MDLFSDLENARFENIPIKGGELILMRDFLSANESEELFIRLNNTIDWKETTIELFGKVHKLQREIAWYGDPGKTYHYSGLTLNPLPWTKDLKELKNKIEDTTGEVFNTVLLNKYRHGNDKVGWHSDHEKEFGRISTIASLSLGASRFFDVRNKWKKQEKFRIDLHSGTLLLMKGEFQHNWEHQVPRQTNIAGIRINLTFRQMKFELN